MLRQEVSHGHSFSFSFSLSPCKHVTCNNGPTRITEGLNLVNLILTRFGDLWGAGNLRLRSRLGATEELAAAGMGVLWWKGLDKREATEPHCLLSLSLSLSYLTQIKKKLFLLSAP